MGKLYIIATNHYDQVNGPKKLLSLYDRIKPDMVLSEISEPDSVRIRNFGKYLGDRFKKLTPDHARVDKFIETITNIGGFEYQTNEQYASDHRIPHHLIDLPGGQKKFIDKLEKMWQDFLKKERFNGGIDIGLLLKAFNESTYKSLDKIRSEWENLSKAENTFRLEALFLYLGIIPGRIGKPDRYMEERVRELHNPDKVVACTVGMCHALNSKFNRTLYSRIKDLTPIRVPLI